VTITKPTNLSRGYWGDHRLIKTLLIISLQPKCRPVKCTLRPSFNVNLLQKPAVKARVLAEN